MIVPLPFSKAIYLYGDPFEGPPDSGSAPGRRVSPACDSGPDVVMGSILHGARERAARDTNRDPT